MMTMIVDDDDEEEDDDDDGDASSGLKHRGSPFPDLLSAPRPPAATRRAPRPASAAQVGQTGRREGGGGKGWVPREQPL